MVESNRPKANLFFVWVAAIEGFWWVTRANLINICQPYLDYSSLKYLFSELQWFLAYTRVCPILISLSFISYSMMVFTSWHVMESRLQRQYMVSITITSIIVPMAIAAAPTAISIVTTTSLTPLQQLPTSAIPLPYHFCHYYHSPLVPSAFPLYCWYGFQLAILITITDEKSWKMRNWNHSCNFLKSEYVNFFLPNFHG